MRTCTLDCAWIQFLWYMCFWTWQRSCSVICFIFYWDTCSCQETTVFFPHSMILNVMQSYMVLEECIWLIHFSSGYLLRSASRKEFQLSLMRSLQVSGVWERRLVTLLETLHHLFPSSFFYLCLDHLGCLGFTSYLIINFFKISFPNITKTHTFQIQIFNLFI